MKRQPMTVAGPCPLCHRSAVPVFTRTGGPVAEVVELVPPRCPTCIERHGTGPFAAFTATFYVRPPETGTITAREYLSDSLDQMGELDHDGRIVAYSFQEAK